MAKKYIILSVNENPEYLFYLPLTIWAWKRFGWTPIVFYTDPNTPYSHLMARLNEINGYRSDTIAQVSRLFAGDLPLQGNPMIMTGDIDMIPLSDYWHPKEGDITIYGHDLTGYGHYPICYIAMNRERWVEVMGHNPDYNAHIKTVLDKYPQARFDYDPIKRWVVDQDIITGLLDQTQFKKEYVSRGTLPNGYPVGRVDRSAWHLDHPKFIDAHLPRGAYGNTPTSLTQIMDLLHKIWPDEDFTWFINHANEYRMMYGNN